MVQLKQTNMFGNNEEKDLCYEVVLLGALMEDEAVPETVEHQTIMTEGTCFAVEVRANHSSSRLPTHQTSRFEVGNFGTALTVYQYTLDVLENVLG